MNDRIFREYDIRGVVDEDLNRDIARSIGKAFGTVIKRENKDAHHVSVGRDVRQSSIELSSGIMEGIASTGIHIYDIGVCPTPVQYFSLFHLDLDGGIMVTGSHNPPEYNGFKISVGTETISGRDIQEIKETILKEEYALSHKRGDIHTYDILKPYRDLLMSQFSYLGDSRFRRIKVVVDAGNGTAGAIVPEILENAGCDVVPLYCEPDGTFPNHHPDPTVVEYIQDLIHETRNSGADIGVGYDGDADRIGVINRDGEIIWGDQLMIVLSRDLLKRNPQAKVIGDVKCSQLMFDDIEKNGGSPIKWKTGHSLVKQKMKEERALLAGEFSGHIFIADRYFGYDDAIYTTFRIIEIMKNTGKDLKELLSDIPRMFHTPEIRIDCPDEKKNDIVKGIVSRFIQYRDTGGAPYVIKDLNTIDGVRVMFDKGWGLIRMSNTQPVIVMRVEAEDAKSLSNYKTFLETELANSMQ